MNGVLKRQWKTYYKKRTDVDNMQEDCVTLQMKPLVASPGNPPGDQRPEKKKEGVLISKKKKQR